MASALKPRRQTDERDRSKNSLTSAQYDALAAHDDERGVLWG